MRIGLDVHGVINKWPDTFRILIPELKKTGFEIYIISGPPKEQIIYELNELNIHGYDKIISVVDFLKETIGEDNMWKDEKGDWWANEENWWSSKAIICKQNNIKVMYDDSERYRKYFNENECIFIKL